MKRLSFSPVIYGSIGFLPLVNVGPSFSDTLTLAQAGLTTRAIVRGLECAVCLLWGAFFVLKAYRVRMRQLREEA